MEDQAILMGEIQTERGFLEGFHLQLMDPLISNCQNCWTSVIKMVSAWL